VKEKYSFFHFFPFVNQPWEEAHLKNSSVIRVSWGRMLPHGAFKYPIGKLSDYDMEQVEKAIASFNGLKL